MMMQFGKNMNYNITIIVSLIICAIISFIVGFYGVSLFLDEKSAYFKIFQLIVTIVLMMSIYSPIKFMLLKYMNIDVKEVNKDV